MLYQLKEPIHTHIDEVSHGVFHFILDETDKLSGCGAYLLDYVENHPISSESKLLLDIQSPYFSMPCDDIFLQAVSHFESIAYIIGHKVNSEFLKSHALHLHDKNINAHFFADYSEAYMWCMTDS